MEWFETLKEFLTHPGVLLFGTITLFEISPIKINPWKSLLRWISDAVNVEDSKQIKEINERLAKLDASIEEMKKEQARVKEEHEHDKAKEKRWHILDFVNSSRHGRTHTREEWNHTLSELKEYEEFCKDRDIPNGVIDEGAKYLRDLFQEKCKTNDFL